MRLIVKSTSYLHTYLAEYKGVDQKDGFLNFFVLDYEALSGWQGRLARISLLKDSGGKTVLMIPTSDISAVLFDASDNN